MHYISSKDDYTKEAKEGPLGYGWYFSCCGGYFGNSDSRVGWFDRLTHMIGILFVGRVWMWA